MSKHSKVNLWGTHGSTILSITLVLWLLGAVPQILIALLLAVVFDVLSKRQKR